MRPLTQLVQQFPRVFRGKAPEYSDVDPGWSSIAQTFFQRLDHLLGELGCTVEVWQVKEKWGELRIYLRMAALDDVQRAVVDGWLKEARDRSLETCCRCGQPGELRTDRGYVLTLCDVHAAERTNTVGPDV